MLSERYNTVCFRKGSTLGVCVAVWAYTQVCVMFLCFQPGGSEFIPVIADRQTLLSLQRREVLVKRWPVPMRHQFFKIIGTERNIATCPHCLQVRRNVCSGLCKREMQHRLSWCFALIVLPSMKSEVHNYFEICHSGTLLSCVHIATPPPPLIHFSLCQDDHQYADIRERIILIRQEMYENGAFFCAPYYLR